MLHIPRDWPLLSFSGLLVVILYCSFTSTSWLLYAEPYSPITHYLSALGDWRTSVFSALLYNAGCVLTGIALVPFFAGMNKWYTSERWRNGLILVVQVVGALSAGALMMIGVFSQDSGQPHMIASGVFFLLNFIVLLLASVVMVTHPRFMKMIAVFGIGVDVSTLILESVLGGPLVEWFTVFSSLGFVALLSYNTLKLKESFLATEPRL